MRVLVVDFSGKDDLAILLSENSIAEIKVETNDGGRAYKIAREWQPDIVVFNLDAKPAHVRRTAMAIIENKSMAHIRLAGVFEQSAPEMGGWPGSMVLSKREELNLMINDQSKHNQHY